MVRAIDDTEAPFADHRFDDVFIGDRFADPTEWIMIVLELLGGELDMRQLLIRGEVIRGGVILGGRIFDRRGSIGHFGCTSSTSHSSAESAPAQAARAEFLILFQNKLH